MTDVRKGTDLIDFQERLNANLDEADRFGRLASLVGFQTAGKHWLVNLGDLREISGMPSPEKIVRLALTKSWVPGIANFKGNIYTLCDFQMFLGHSATVQNFNSRVLLVHPKHLISAGIIVQTVLGLIGIGELEAVSSESVPWSSQAFRSKDGIVWHLLDVAALSESPDILNIEA